MTALERAGYLAHATSEEYAERLAEAQSLLAMALAAATRPYIAFSTGKDSTVCAHLAWSVDPTIPAIYIDAHCAFPGGYELLDQMIADGQKVIVLEIDHFLDTLEEIGGPEDPRCDGYTLRKTVFEPVKHLADDGWDLGVVGVRAEESPQRRARLQRQGLWPEELFCGMRQVTPIGHWTTADVWAFIVSEGCRYNRTYDEMDDLPQAKRRVSYWAGETARHRGRWTWLRRHYPELWVIYAERFPYVRRFS